MEYKLLRMLLLFLQIGLIILVVLLVSLVIFPSKMQANDADLLKNHTSVQTKQLAFERFVNATEQHKNMMHMQALEKRILHTAKPVLKKELQLSHTNKNEFFTKKA
jgi:hypothetical protein